MTFKGAYMQSLAGGFSCYRNKVDLEVIANMVVTGGYRGDNYSLRCLGPDVIMGACQPNNIAQDEYIVDEDDVFLSWDGRLDNRDELCDLLSIPPMSEVSDGRLILKCYQRWGREFPKKVIADFALALWDKRNQSLILARDFAGVRPLFYVQEAGMIYWASTISQLLMVPGMTDGINEDYIIDAMIYPMVGPLRIEKTASPGVCRVLPAQQVLIKKDMGVVSKETYWDPNCISELRHKDVSDYTERFLDLFKQAVASRVQYSNGAGGFELSGGLDSGSVTSIAGLLAQQDKIKRDLYAYSIVYDEFPEADERKYMTTVSNTYPVKRTEIVGDDYFLLKGLFTGGVPVTDEPFMAMVDYPKKIAIAEIAQRHGVDVMLTGELGDVVFQGNHMFLADRIREGRLMSFVKEARHLAKASNRSYFEILISLVAKPLMPAFLQKLFTYSFGLSPGYWHYLYKMEGPHFPIWLSKEITSRCDLDERADYILPDRNVKRFSLKNDYRIACVENGSCTLDDYVLRPKGIVRAIPFLDRRFYEYLLSIPPELKYKIDAEGKIIRKVALRDAMKDILPEPVRTRRSNPALGNIFQKGLTREWYPIAKDFRQLEVVKQGFADPEILAQASNRWMGGFLDDLGCLMFTIVLESWLRNLNSKKRSIYQQGMNHIQRGKTKELIAKTVNGDQFWHE